MDHDDARRLGRREMMRRSLVVLAAAPAVTAIGCGGGALECTPGPAGDQAMRTALHYVDHGPDASRHCVRCQLYTGGESACGTCSVVAGGIHPQGTCDSFVARS
ncbi:hypothetical protein [Sandaracinus amylolyticus]|uniref:hypothetical protein n=1 Tax=Sandaracinus amylolyticus TaxID=927083 RepID=UPI001F3CAEC8|nr:hypothetical protein [Sandaracinus amylolyticus]UJR84155.1 Hypothetical protein I5071_62260 [Sandaracinus amylolyticus]